MTALPPKTPFGVRCFGLEFCEQRRGELERYVAPRLYTKYSWVQSPHAAEYA
jgi:hypothetical protein